ncbi:serine/threonine protein phosphatase [Paenibacillus sp. FSL W8-0919]|uniref:PP2C family protein-serine/threonine phosphatase n=1 Tax=Paenibacillus sp. FSL W8-0919 TaxID=2954707 RepID=UPI0030FA9A72
MRRENSEFLTEFLSEGGTSLTNKDYFAYMELDDMACWVMADGLDTDDEVESAETAVKVLMENFQEKPTLSRFRLKRYLKEASDILKFESRRVRLKASLVMVVTNYSKMVYAVSGNSRLYHYRHGRLKHKSKDQSVAQVLADRGRLSEEAVDRHEERHNLLNYLGIPRGFKPYVSRKRKLSDGDVLLLCTSGAWEGVSRGEMQAAVEGAEKPAALLDTLEDVLLSKQRPVIPNYSMAAVYANKTYQEDPNRRKKYIKLALAVLIPLILVGGGTYVYKVREAAKKAEAAAGIVQHEQNGDQYIEDENYAEAVKEYSEGRNDAIKVKNKVHTALLGRKLRVSQLILEGDKVLKEGDYEKALTHYGKAKKEAQGISVFDPQILAKKEEDAGNVQKVMELVKEGELKMQGGDYAGAKLVLDRARLSAIEHSLDTVEKDIKATLDEADLKLASIAREQKKLQGEKLEAKADRSLAKENYEAAIDTYIMAQAIYQEIDMLEKVLGLERKITKAEEKLNPIPQAPAGLPVQQPGIMADGQYGVVPGGYAAPNAGGQMMITPPDPVQPEETQAQDEGEADALSADGASGQAEDGEDEGR